MRLGLGARLAIAFALLAAITALVTAGVASASTNRRVKDDVDRFLENRAADIAEGRRGGPVRPPAQGNGPKMTEPQESVLRAVEADAIVQLIDGNGIVLGSTGIALPVSQADLTFVDDFAPLLLRSEIIGDEEYRMITAHIAGGGAVQVARSVSGRNALLGSIRSELLVLGLALSGIAGLVGWGVASRTTRPLRQLTRSIESIRHTRDLTQSVALDRDDELGRVSESFDDLLRSLAASRDQQQRLVQDAAHELRTPITSVRANIDFLERVPNLDDDTRRATLASIRSELSELSDLLAEVVELATESRDRTAFEPVDLVGAAEAALAQFELRSSRPVDRAMTSSVVMGDQQTLSRAIGNLVANADKYTPDENAPIRITVAHGEVNVADRGVGIADGERDQIFERFWRSDQARSAAGSGLGLAIVKKAVEEHGGSVFARSRLGGGSEIGFQLPVAHDRVV